MNTMITEAEFSRRIFEANAANGTADNSVNKDGGQGETTTGKDPHTHNNGEPIGHGEAEQAVEEAAPKKMPNPENMNDPNQPPTAGKDAPAKEQPIPEGVTVPQTPTSKDPEANKNSNPVRESKKKMRTTSATARTSSNGIANVIHTPSAIANAAQSALAPVTSTIHNVTSTVRAAVPARLRAMAPTAITVSLAVTGIVAVAGLWLAGGSLKRKLNEAINPTV